LRRTKERDNPLAHRPPWLRSDSGVQQNGGRARVQRAGGQQADDARSRLGERHGDSGQLQ
ncbi:hypothetical protein K1W54_11215, partial [Micromonospora sp. CPCC 205371]|nr:hypothetical protein [Micromonospora sp. CPCC 205371]